MAISINFYVLAGLESLWTTLEKKEFSQVHYEATKFGFEDTLGILVTNLAQIYLGICKVWITNINGKCKELKKKS
jgi:hypothetical protein